MSLISCRCGERQKNFIHLTEKDVPGGYEDECCAANAADALEAMEKAEREAKAKAEAEAAAAKAKTEADAEAKRKGAGKKPQA